MVTAIVAKKPTFAKLPIDANGLILSDLQALYTDNQAFESSLIQACPVSKAVLGSYTRLIHTPSRLI